MVIGLRSQVTLKRLWTSHHLMKTDGTVLWRSLRSQLQARGAYDREQFIKG
jgi:hypothetical protein